MLCNISNGVNRTQQSMYTQSFWVIEALMLDDKKYGQVVKTLSLL